MKALLYITKRSMVNNLKKALKRPITYLYIAGIVAYALFILSLLIGGLGKIGFLKIEGLVVVITVWTFYVFFTNFISYAKKKGVIFLPSHAHFIFTAPLSPKVILLYGAKLNFSMNFIASIIFSIGGVLVFKISLIQSLLVFIFAFVLETILEGSIIVFLYGNEKLPRKLINAICSCIIVLLIATVALGIWYFRRYGISLASASAIIEFEGLQMIPLVGWNIAAFRLILLGPTTINVIATILYMISVVVAFLIAKKMECTGNYYEEAAKFADDYVEARTKGKNGEMVFSIGKKKKFKNASITYEGTGAKAIFYRQLLEYKKERFFIFTFMTLVSVGVAIIVVKFIGKPPEKMPINIVLLAIVGYMVLLTTGYIGKWEKELKNYYLYLIPDSAVKKLWYATAIEHIKATIDACIIIIPIGIAWRIHPVQMLLVIMVYVVFQANKLYMRVLADALVGNTLGTVGKNILRVTAQTSMLGLGIGLGVAAGYLINFDFVFLIVLIYSMIVTGVVAILASSRFSTMEQFD